MDECKRDGCIDNKRHKSPYCSNACKQADHRSKCNTPSVTEPCASVTDVSVTRHEQPSVTQAHATADELAHGITVELDEPATSVSIGVVIEQPDIDQLPPGVTKPTGRRTAAAKAMTASQLKHRVSSYKGVSWIDSPEYAETIYRLLTLDVDTLTEQGQFIPVWRLNKCA